MKITRTLLLSWSMKAIVFLLRGAGWAAIGIFVGFVVSYFFRFSGRVDVFALVEGMLGIVITGLAIVGAFIIALQWSDLDSRMHVFDIKTKETKETFDKFMDNIHEYAKDLINKSKSAVKEYEEQALSIKRIHDETIDRWERERENMSRYMVEYNESNTKLNKIVTSIEALKINFYQQSIHMRYCWKMRNVRMLIM